MRYGIRKRVSDQFPNTDRGGVSVSLGQGRLPLGQCSRCRQHAQQGAAGQRGTVEESKTMRSWHLRRFGIEACPEPEQWGPSPVLCLSPERAEGLGVWGTCPQVWVLCRVWLLSLVLLIGLSACGPMPADPAASLESRTSLSGPSASHSVPQNSSSSMTERTQEGATESVVAPGDTTDDAGSEPDTWGVGQELAQSEYETEQEERSGERKNR